MFVITVIITAVIVVVITALSIVGVTTVFIFAVMIVTPAVAPETIKSAI